MNDCACTECQCNILTDATVCSFCEAGEHHDLIDETIELGREVEEIAI